MRYRLMATYLGVPYHAGLGPDGNDATLFSPAPPPDELGFTAAGGHWRKQVSLTDLDALWQSRLVGEYRGEPCLILDDLGDRLHIVYLGRDSVRARQLGYWEIDREVFEVVVARPEVTGLTEERAEYPLASAMFPPSNRDLAVQARPEAPGRGGPVPQAAGGPSPSVTERTGPLRIVPRPGPQPAADPERIPRSGRTQTADTTSRADTPRPADTRIARRVRRTGSRPGTARRAESPGPRRSRCPRRSRGPRRNRWPRKSPGPRRSRWPRRSRGPRRSRWPRKSPGPRRRPPRRPGDVPGGGTGCRSRSSPNFSAWLPSRTRPMRSTRRCRAPCAWSKPTAASRCSAVPTTPGWMCASSKTRKRPTFTCLASWPPKPSAAGAYALDRLTGASTDPAGLACPRPPRKTFRSTYGARNYPNQHPVQLSLISRRG